MKLNIGCGNNILDPKEWINIDKNSVDSRVYKYDIEELIKIPRYWDIPTVHLESPELRLLSILEEITEVRAYHVLEHIDNLDRLMKWLHGICAYGATIDIVVPLANTLWAVANPDHKRSFNHRTFQYYTKDFETSDLGLFRGFEIISQHIEREPDEWFEGVNWIVANLHIKLKVV